MKNYNEEHFYIVSVKLSTLLCNSYYTLYFLLLDVASQYHKMKGILKVNLLVLLVIVLGLGTCSAQTVHDEVAINAETDETAAPGVNQVFGPVYHKVTQGETIETILKDFNMNRYQFNTWNPQLTGITAGTDVVIKYKWYNKADLPKTNNPQSKSAESDAKYHQVKDSETLYHIAAEYHITVKQLKEWNNLPEGAPLKMGQQLKVSK
jgi:LysM repeat protein